ncbi:selenocysteine lyase/cysteine desulfurase [Pseudonocardia hierapolitana]|uniref:Selenocysteine lyase/cysteine desulfurase n=1 Tax=Pseudonocardia hierapolitana TaxID=1128676 RepID=A0A561SY78_9PSEU|nr:aminotransferase class V-fold PLP-dependent enzyme [Pseudonocardia hierapolitana]TWF79824.1 selenocysteine lyase/cysteine desulfurase [Pseudonocardia hierapolitana]
MTAVLSARPGICAPATVTGTDLRVPLVTGEHVRYANLDLAASAPALTAVADHVAALLPYYASVHRGAGYASQVCTAVLEKARETVGRFVGARADDVVVFTRNTTDALNLLAGCVPGPALRLDVEHHANLLAWGPGRVLRAAPTVAQTLADLRYALAADRPALLAVTGASNVTGELLPLEEITAIAHAAGARVVVDAAQLAPHRPVDIATTGIDYLALSGHKLYAPYGAGALVGRRDWLDVATPYLSGGGAVHAVTAPDEGGATEVSWAPAPHRHEAGTPNVLGAAALAEACRVLSGALDPAHEAALLDRLETGLDALPGIRTLRIWPDSPDRVAVCTFVVDGHPAGRVAAYLSAEHGIGVRDGKFCAHPLLSRLAGTPDGCAVRASLGLGTTVDDVDRLVDAVEWLVTDGPGWDYAVVDGRWSPVPDPRETDPLGIGTPTGPALPGCGH